MEEVGAPMAKPSDCMYVFPQNWKQFCSIIVSASLEMSCLKLFSM